MSLLKAALLVMVILYLVFSNTKRGGKIIEKNLILKLLLFAVSLFIKNEKGKEGSLKEKWLKFFAEKLLFFDLLLLKFRSREVKIESRDKLDGLHKK